MVMENLNLVALVERDFDLKVLDLCFMSEDANPVLRIQPVDSSLSLFP